MFSLQRLKSTGTRLSNSSLTYRDAGVDIDAGDAFVEAIKPIAKRTLRDGCLSGLGGFGGLFEIPAKFKRPVLVSGTDGVGTKLKYAFELNRHDTIGVDLVAMCVNDVLVQGAEPLFFLDYFATGRLSPEVATAVMTGIGEGCRQAGVALIGGETAEMPGMYPDGEYDLAGFCVGAVERDRILDGSAIKTGDTLIALPASGPHANGYSLIRRIVTDRAVNLDVTLAGRPLGEQLLTPTRIYVRPVLDLLDALPVHGLAHITGGGLPGNLRRILPPGTRAVISTSAWQWPPIFRWLAEQSTVATEEMYRTFNCGIGMVAVVAEDTVNAALARLEAGGENAFVIGRIEPGPEPSDVRLTD
ncbi:MAG: phosphoribosylformylglycinamidine cyclo-ligase [Gammaproteobacteria bacterium]|nr:phosphoribosylformylglycinamidine cyclo-ligase [Gammaproteobacteria bacterium]